MDHSEIFIYAELIDKVEMLLLDVLKQLTATGGSSSATNKTSPSVNTFKPTHIPKYLYFHT